MELFDRQYYIDKIWKLDKINQLLKEYGHEHLADVAKSEAKEFYKKNKGE